MTIRTLVVDDEPLARERLRRLLEEEQDVDVLAECADGREAVRSVDQLRPDLVFLDVQMPEIDGFEVLAAIDPPQMPAVVFVTAYDAYALQAFEVHALDYLLKPFDRERFHRTMEHVRARLTDAGGLDRRLVALLDEIEAARPRPRPRRFVVRSGGRIQFLDADRIDWIEGAGNYVKLHVGGREHLLRSTLKAFEEQLDPHRFVRIHRSHIVNLDRVTELQPWFHGEFVVVLTDGTELRSSRTYSDRLRAMIGDVG